MVQFLKALGLGLSTVSVLVAASPMPVATPAPSLKDAVALEKRASCTFTDAVNASKSKKSCATIVLSNIAVPSGTTLDMTSLTSGTHVIFEGTTTWGYEEWSGPLFSVSGANIVVSGASGHVLNGEGAKWWDGEGTNGGKTKPKFFYAHSLSGTSSITGLNVLNTPVQGFSVNGITGTLALTDITIDNSAGDTGALGHNTDAFDVGSSTGVTISGANIKNQDDCLAVNSGTNIVFTGGTCSGGHGLSIGSVGGRDDNTVSGVTISSSTITNSANGVRIKTVSGATGSVEDVTYKDITLSGITSYGIVIEQDYENGSPTGTPTTGVPITGLTVSNVKGSVASTATNIYILCGSGSCSDWTWSGNSVTGGKTSTKCTNIPSGASC
ncbi:Polygalacturonase [Lachnellula suecica]|uniref:endo-polygalacturonase n=1 Tax=Lachnellula suecica TaxID=602035 RepID=A0A8T9CDF2_9HELO|nr:Polygalacturonase [Lachnellula suecica]